MSQELFDQPLKTLHRVVSQSVASGTVTPNLNGGSLQFITVPTGQGVFTLANPNPSPGFPGDTTTNFMWYLRLKNSSGGALTVTLGNKFLSVTPTYPADTKSRIYTFLWDGTNHILMYQSAADLG